MTEGNNGEGISAKNGNREHVVAFSANSPRRLAEKINQFLDGRSITEVREMYFATAAVGDEVYETNFPRNMAYSALIWYEGAKFDY